MILRESGQLELALNKLEENASQIVDRVAYMETRGNLTDMLTEKLELRMEFYMLKMYHLLSESFS